MRVSEKIKRVSWLLFELALLVMVAAFGLLTICACFESLWWRAYLVAQFRVQIAIGCALLSLVILGIKKRRKYATIPALITLFNCAYFLPIYFPRASSGTQTESSLRLLQLNVNNLNSNHAAVVKYVRSVHPDILLITELTDEWKRILTDELLDYKHTVLVPRPDTYGIGVYSTVKLSDAKVKYYGSSGHPTIVCKITKLEEPTTLVLTHVQGPVKSQFFEWHKEQLLVMTEELQLLPSPLVVAGDMNSTPWTYLTSELIRKCDLVDSRQGFGLQLTWPAPDYWRKVPVVLLPIDHCFVSPQLTVVNRTVGPFVGSDHFPVFVDLE